MWSFYCWIIFLIVLPVFKCQDNSPRISSNVSSASIVVRNARSVYGILSLSLLPPFSTGFVSEGSHVGILISRTGGSLGPISARVRTVGGGESWDQDFDQTATGGSNDTIGGILRSRNINNQATVGQDYVQLDAALDFADSETAKSVFLDILNNTKPEYDENVYIYIKPLTDGIRAAQPSLDSGFQGYSILTINKHGLWNGWIGFFLGNSSSVFGDLDSGKSPVLTIERQNFTNTSVSVYWRVTDVLQPLFPPVNLAELLIATSGSVTCPGERFCTFTIQLVVDHKPRNETRFVVELFLDPSTTSALIDPSRRSCNVTLLKSNYPDGLIQFSLSSRTVIVSQNTTVVQLNVERLGYLGKVIMVAYGSVPIDAPLVVAGLTVSPAIEGADYVRSVGIIKFDIDTANQPIVVSLDPSKASGFPLPKMFRFQLISVTSGAELRAQWSNVTIVDAAGESFWQVWAETQSSLSNDSVLSIMKDVLKLLPKNITASQLVIVQDILNTAINVKAQTKLMPSSTFSIMDVFCALLQAGKLDATRGRWGLSKQLERFAYSMIDHSVCDLSLDSPDCANVNFQVYRKYPDDINSMSWDDGDQNNFIIPSNLLPVQTQGRYSSNPTCFTLVMISYKTEQWFTSSATNQLLNSRILSASIENIDSQSLSQPIKFKVKSPSGTFPPTLSNCVYFSEAFTQWTSGVCSVQNNLILRVDRFVSCSCAHMSAYAVQVNSGDNLLVGYPIWFHISCFICMGCLVLAILTHHLCHLCHPSDLFPANLLMHMCFAIIATEICYVIDAFLSPWHILNAGPSDDNDRCIIMSLFLHYFFVAQFCWLMLQSINLYRVLLLNDENSRRFYFTFFMIGWGAPVLFVGLFYLVVYLTYRFATNFPVDRIYGDVLRNSDFCFITNGYVALGGILLPCVVCLGVAVFICVQAFVMHQQWGDYDNIYVGRRNVIEMKILMGFWSVFVLTCLWMALHVSLGQMWTVILFVIFNILLGLYGLVAYAIIRWNIFLEFCLPEKTQNSSMRELPNTKVATSAYAQPIRMPNDSNLVINQDSLKKPKMKELSDSGSEGRKPTLHVRRSAPSVKSPVDIMSPYDKRQSSHGLNILDDFDDIIYSLKEERDLEYKSRDGKYDVHHRGWDDHLPTVASFYNDDLTPIFPEKKRINIADTHI